MFMMNVTTKTKHLRAGKKDAFAAKRHARSVWGNILTWFIILLIGFFLALPLIYSVASSLKPYNEIYIFPPKILVSDPTFDNFIDLFNLCSNLTIPFSRYLFNSLLITFVVTVLQIVISSMCAYPLAKNKFPGSKMIFSVMVTSLLFVSAVTFLPQYMIVSKLKLLNTVFAMILPAISGTFGVFLMKQFMEGVPDSIIEAARIDGCSEYTVFWRIMMPNVRPAWLTLTVFSFQGIWNSGGQQFVFRDDLRTLPVIIQQLTNAGYARVGVSAASTVFLMLPPIILFIIVQSQVVETMAHAAIKE